MNVLNESSAKKGKEIILHRDTSSKSRLDKGPMKPRSTEAILTEDEFSQGISKIIERDFFPDIPKLEAQTEYFEALERNDLVKLREIQMRCPDTGVSDGACTPATFETPAKKSKPAAQKTQTDSHELLMKDDDVVEQDEKNTTDTPKLKLDSFLSRNTSEDSASFAAILKESDQKRRIRHAWLFDKETEQLSEHKNYAALPSIEDQAAITARPTRVDTWKYQNENAVMYVPDGLELSAAEEINEKKFKPREIIHENTRFHSVPFNNIKSKEAMQKAASFKALINQGKIGHDGKEMMSQSPQVNGYGFVGTPSPAPGVSESPLMTWGEIESTPSRLDAGDMPAATPGPKFRIPDIPKRDKLAHQLSEQASKAHRAKKTEALRQVTRRFASPSPSARISITSTERINSMSPAAQRLASKRLGIRTSTDKALQASYSPSPSRSPSTKTPVRRTPSKHSSNRSTPGASPAVKTPDERGQTPSSQENAGFSSSLTDHLLNLPKRKRKSASDFF